MSERLQVTEQGKTSFKPEKARTPWFEKSKFKIFKVAAPIIAIGITAILSACDKSEAEIPESNGSPTVSEQFDLLKFPEGADCTEVTSILEENINENGLIPYELDGRKYYLISSPPAITITHFNLNAIALYDSGEVVNDEVLKSDADKFALHIKAGLSNTNVAEEGGFVIGVSAGRSVPGGFEDISSMVGLEPIFINYKDDDDRGCFARGETLTPVGENNE